MSLNRIYSQYRGKPKIVKWLNIVNDMAAPLFSTAELVRTSYDIDTATTYELDTIGHIIGLQRDKNTFLLKDSPGYGNMQYGTGQYTGAGQFKDINAANDVFRLLLKAKIAKNVGDASVDNIIEAMTILIPGSKPQVIDGDDWSFSIAFDIKLTEIQRFVLNTFDVFPRGQCVKFTGFTEP